MKKRSFSVLFYIRITRLNKAGEAPVLLRITVNGRREELCIHRSVNPTLWNTVKGKFTDKGKGGKELSLYLDTIHFRLLRAQFEMELEGQSVTATTVLNRYLGKYAPVRHTLFELFREHNGKCRNLTGIDYAATT